MKQRKKLQKWCLARIRTSDPGYYNCPSYVIIEYFFASLMITMNDFDVILKYTRVPCLHQCTRLV